MVTFVYSLFQQFCNDSELVGGIKYGMNKAGDAVKESLLQHIRLEETEHRTIKQSTRAIVFLSTTW